MFSTCALLDAGTVTCWGARLGSGDTVSSPVTVPNLSGVTELSLGASSACALLHEGTVECWGYNGNGELGNGTTVNSSDPVAVSNLNGVTSIVVGARGSSPCALLQDGTVDCWGYNRGPIPVAVLTNLGEARSVSCGNGTGCAVLSDTTLACSGANTYGEVGNGGAPQKSGAAMLVVVR